MLLCFASQSSLTEARVNLARNKSYTFSPKPNYYLCTDKSDAIQLTDGRKSGSKWTNKSTVGWQKAEPAVEIIIDIGEKSAIYEIRVHTVGGGFADVEFPKYIAVLLSDDHRTFRFGGLISNKYLTDIRSSGFRGVERTMSIENINTSGRYIKLIIMPTKRYVFLDEIEVLGDSLSALKNIRLRENLRTFSSNKTLLEKIEDYLQFDENVTTTLKTIKDSEFASSNGQYLKELEGLARKTNTPTNTIHSTRKLDAMKNRFGKIRAGIYKTIYKKPYVCLPAEPTKIVFEKEMPLHENKRDINIQAWQNEYESAAFNIINCSDEALTMSVSISPLLNSTGEQMDSHRTFTIRRAIYIKGSGVGSIADALVLQGERLFVLQPGELTQIWLTIFNPTLAAGIYRGRIGALAKTESDETLPIESLPVTIKVQKYKLPPNIALNTCNWAYYRIASQAEMAEDLFSHHINVFVVPPHNLPFLRFTSDRPGVIRKPNYTRLDNNLRNHNYARTYLLALDFNSSKKDRGRFGKVKWMTPEWKNVFTSWLRELVRHLKNAGVGYDKFALYPFDESLCNEFYELAKLIKNINPQIRIYANSFSKGPKDFVRFRELVDIWCLQDSHCQRHPEWLEQIKSFGKEVWTYECLEPMKAQEPYSYYRLLPWRAFKRGQTGAGFWIYYYGLNFKAGAVPWNDTQRPMGFSGVVYGSIESLVKDLGENIVPSRRWEAWREGVEDYQYLHELQQAINETRLKDPATANKTQEILDSQVNRVLSKQDDSKAVYEAREILSDMLLKLTSQGN
jgi:hypothetical protein